MDIKELLGKITTSITAITLLTFALGTIIINVNLQSYGITDYELLKPRTILTGLVFLVVIILHFSFCYYQYFNDNTGKWYKLKLSGRILLIPFVLTLLMLIMLEPALTIESILSKSRPLFGVNFTVIFATGLVFVPPTIYILDGNSRFEVVIRAIMNVFMVIEFVLLYSIFSDVEIAGKLFLFNINTSFVFSILNSFLVDIYIVTKENLSYSEKIKIYFKSKTPRKVLLFFSFLCMLLVTSIILYSLNLYPYISQTFGGGKPCKIELKIDSVKVTGYKIYEAGNYIYLKDSIQTKYHIVKIDWNQVDEINTFK